MNTAITLRHRETGVEAHASERRSAQENERKALRRMRLNLALEIRRPLPRGPELAEYQPSALWRSRCRDRAIICSAKHRDYAMLLAEALDVLAATDWAPQRAAAVLGCSASQLIKFFKARAHVIGKVNEQRKAMGLHALK